MDDLPPFADDWIPDKYADIRVEEFLDEDYDSSDSMSEISRHVSNAATCASTRGSVRLFDGKRIEEFLVVDDDDNDEPSGREMMTSVTGHTTSNGIPMFENEQPPPRLRYRSPTAEAESNVEDASFVEVVVNNYTNDHPLSYESVGEVPRPSSQTEGMVHSRAPSLHVSKNTEDNDSLISMLRSLEDPRMDAQYLEAYGTCVSYVLHVWPEPPNEKKLEHMKALTNMEQSLHLAGTLRRLCETGSSKIASDLIGTDEGIVIGGSKMDQLMIVGELQSLGEVVQEAMALLQEASSRVHGAPSNTLFPSSGTPAIREPHANDLQSPKETLVRKSTPPFLTWAWLSSGFEQSIPARRVAAENLFTIMQDIDRHLCRSKEDSYTNSSQTTLADLEDQMVLQKAIKEHQDYHAARPKLSVGLATLEEPPSPVSYALGSKFIDDALLQSQKDAIIEVVNNIAATAQSFVGLFIPCSYQHPVSQRIWGSLSDLIQVRAFLLDLRQALECFSFHCYFSLVWNAAPNQTYGSISRAAFSNSLLTTTRMQLPS
jgi:hypothetical protein